MAIENGVLESDCSQWPAVDRRKPGWALDWQTLVERDKAELARILHDDMGGLLVAAIMDITSAEKSLSAEQTATRSRLVRSRSALDDAIKINRKIIEELRPTLLENFGLIAALKWHFSEVCKTSDIDCHQHLPDHVDCAAAASIGLFRAAETMLSVTVGYHPASISLGLDVHERRVALEVAGAGLARPFTREDPETVSAIASVTARVRALGGELALEEKADGLTIRCGIPIAQISPSASSSVA